MFLTLSRLQAIYFVFSNPANNFFNTFLILVLQKNNGPSLMYTGEDKGYIFCQESALKYS